MPAAQGDFISEYMDYASGTEIPDWYNRWSIITSIGAYLGRQFYFEHGHFTVYPNMYVMLIGSSGTKKSTAIKLAKKLMIGAGYTTIAAEKTSKEKFLIDLMDGDFTGEEKHLGIGLIGNGVDILEQNLWGEIDDHDAETFIMADEFNDFFGNNNLEFISLLGNLWDYSGVYRSRIKNGKSIIIHNPTISILGGNTPTNFATAFPTEIFGQGFFSRLLLIYGEPSGKRIPFPRAPAKEVTERIQQQLQFIKSLTSGAAEVSESAEKLLDSIYRTYNQIDDSRFDSYSNRRFTHLIKLCLICAAGRYSKRIDECDVIYANTLLTHAEQLMPKALGEFGKAKHSDVSHRILGILESTSKPLKFKEIWKMVSQDMDDQKQLATLLTNLAEAGKIQSVPNIGFLIKRKIIEERTDGMVDYGLLTEQEKRISR